MKISFITTVLNEEKRIGRFLQSLSAQSTLPDEIIIVDGGSSDGTVTNIKYQISNSKYNKKIRTKIIIKQGNRAVGRNEAIRNATGDIIVCTDGDCLLDKNWVKNIIEPFFSSKVDVVAGYYRGMPKNIFQKCLIPYVLVMPDRINPQTFLPATRSMGFRKRVWEKIGGFPEEFAHNEDYVFAQKIKNKGFTIVFAKSAIVSWIPRDTLWESFVMFFRFAYGDIEARIFRPKVGLIFLRYAIGLTLLAGSLKFHSFLPVLFVFLICYLTWSIAKNYRYVEDWRAIFILPIIQITADVAVIFGSLLGLIQ